MQIHMVKPTTTPIMKIGTEMIAITADESSTSSTCMSSVILSNSISSSSTTGTYSSSIGGHWYLMKPNPFITPDS